MKQLFNSIKIIAIALIIGLGVSYVSAAPWSAPGTGATGGNTVASVNVSEYGQTKIGSFTTDNFFKAGGVFNATGASWNKPGYAIAEKAFISPWSFFTSAFLPGNTSQVKIGGGDDATTDIFNAAVTPFTIDLAGRGTGNNSVSGRQVIDIRTDALACYPNATIRTNTPAVELLNSKTGDNADAIVRGIQLSGGNPAPGKILVSTDANGNAVWGTPTLSGGQIVFTYGTSPAATGQALCSTPPAAIQGCTNPSATNYNPNATVDNGSCTLPLNCPAGQYAEGGQCLCGSGIREGQVPNTNIQTTGKIITYANSVNQNPGGGGAPLVPYYVVLDELRNNGGPGNVCKIVAWDSACPAFDLDTMRGFGGVPVTSFTFDGITYQTTGGFAWEIDNQIGDQCIANSLAQVGGPELIMMNIEP